MAELVLELESPASEFSDVRLCGFEKIDILDSQRKVLQTKSITVRSGWDSTEVMPGVSWAIHLQRSSLHLISRKILMILMAHLCNVSFNMQIIKTFLLVVCTCFQTELQRICHQAYNLPHFCWNQRWNSHWLQQKTSKLTKPGTIWYLVIDICWEIEKKTKNK